MSYELIITEKPSSAKKIALALSDSKPISEKKNAVEYFKVTNGKQDIVVACAVGHLYSVAEKEKTRTYPSFNLEWKPTFEVEKSAAHTKKYHQVLKSLSKDAKDVTVACDYDIEGEVIGLNVVREICKRKDASRMKYSTLTTKELRASYDNKSKTLDWGQALAGETRHFLDWMYGVNVSRALTSAVKTTGRYLNLTSGRVQGPALKILVDREREIQAFKSEPFWQVQLTADAKGKELVAMHEQDKFQDKKLASKVHKNADQKTCSVLDVNASRFEQAPPTPFDLTSLQTEAYKVAGISPKDALAIAQTLYLKGLISYPRTSSQQLPSSLQLRDIISNLKLQAPYKELASMLLAKKDLTPNNGKKTDPAHPAIHPTGEKPGALHGRDEKIYDLIVRRTLATFGDPATRETVTLILDSGGEKFVAKGTRTVQLGWHVFYGPHLRFSEDQLPGVKKGEVLKVISVELLEKETQHPKRYTPASIIKQMEKLNLGTKSTRAATIDTLGNRGYIEGQPMKATELGLQTIEVLEKYVPEIIDIELTRHFEDELEEIREKKKTEDQVLDEAKEFLTRILGSFKKKEKTIGEELKKSSDIMRDLQRTVGPCPVCKEGTLVMKRGKFGQFIACDKYPDCTATFGIPSTSLVKPTGKVCETCQHPIVNIIKKRSRPQEICINPLCPTKEQPKIDDGRKCPKCSKNLVLRKSVYGAFYGCSGYPKCRYTERTK
ncbi:MAG: DNA topoisomerase I [Candidatus Woesearchaeota archaeon]